MISVESSRSRCNARPTVDADGDGGLLASVVLAAAQGQDRGTELWDAAKRGRCGRRSRTAGGRRRCQRPHDVRCDGALVRLRPRSPRRGPRVDRSRRGCERQGHVLPLDAAQLGRGARPRAPRRAAVAARRRGRRRRDPYRRRQRLAAGCTSGSRFGKSIPRDGCILSRAGIGPRTSGHRPTDRRHPRTARGYRPSPCPKPC